MIIEMLSEVGRWGPTPENGAGIGKKCPGCGYSIQAGDVPALVNGVPADEEEAQKAAEGKAHNVKCQIAHEDCAVAAMKHKVIS